MLTTAQSLPRIANTDDWLQDHRMIYNTTPSPTRSWRWSTTRSHSDPQLRLKPQARLQFLHDRIIAAAAPVRRPQKSANTGFVRMRLGAWSSSHAYRSRCEANSQVVLVLWAPYA